MNSVSKSPLLLLQHGDSFFPSGSIAFSYGLETCCSQGRIQTAEQVQAFLVDHLAHRWVTFDRSVVAAAWQHASSAAQLCEHDALVEAMTLASELREGSKRNGRALLGVHSKLDTEGARAFQIRVKHQEAHAHLSVVQGFAWRSVGISLTDALAMSAHGLCVAILGAALRLGVIGHLAAQAILAETHPVIDAAIASQPPGIDQIHSYAPVIDIAAMRHEVQSVRLFSS